MRPLGIPASWICPLERLGFQLSFLNRLHSPAGTAHPSSSKVYHSVLHGLPCTFTTTQHFCFCWRDIILCSSPKEGLLGAQFHVFFCDMTIQAAIMNMHAHLLSSQGSWRLFTTKHVCAGKAVRVSGAQDEFCLRSRFFRLDMTDLAKSSAALPFVIPVAKVNTCMLCIC